MSADSELVGTADKHGDAAVEPPEEKSHEETSLKEYLNKIHKVWVVALIVMTTGFTTIAWNLQPSAVGPISVPSSSLYFKLRETPVASDLRITETLLLLGGTKSDLSVYISSDPPAGSKILHWQLSAYGFQGHICKGSSGEMAGTQRSFGNGVSTITGESEGPEEGQVLIDLCWSGVNYSPGSLNGSFLSALVPEFYLPGRNFDKLTRSVQIGSNFNSAALQEYSIQAGSQPTHLWPNTWEYDEADPYTGTIVYAVNIAGLQEDSHNAFLSGVLFGVAGAGLIALLQELTVSAGKRREKDI
jgi:hypothetical protein